MGGKLRSLLVQEIKCNGSSLGQQFEEAVDAIIDILC